MKRLPAFLLALSVGAVSAQAQISVQLRTEKGCFLLYEAIPVVVSLHNAAGRTVQLEGAADHSWLTFSVSEETGSSVLAAGRPSGRWD